MTITERLEKICSHNLTQVEQFEALYELRNMLSDEPALEIYCAAEVLLHDTEGSLLEVDKDHMRKLGYDFREDLENARELLTRRPDNG